MFRSVSVILTANATTFASQMRAAGAAMDDFHRKAEGGAAKAEASAMRAHKALTGLAVVAGGILAAGLASSVKAAGEFEVAMRNVSTLSESVRNNFAASSKQVIDLSTRLPQSAKTLAEGLYEIASSGFQGADGMEVLAKSATAASAGLTTTNVAAKGITAVLNAYGKSAAEAGDVSDILFQTVNLGVVTFEELSGQLGDFVGTASQLGVPIEDAASAFAAMTLSGVSAAESATSVNRVMLSFIKPSKDMAAAAKFLGFESSVAMVHQLGLKRSMEALGKATGGSVESMARLFPEVRGLRGALALLAAEGANYNRAAEGISNANNRAGATQNALNEQMKSAAAQWKIFRNEIDAGRIALGTALLPVLVDVMKGIQSFAHDALPSLRSAWEDVLPFFETMGEVGQNVIEIVGGLIGSFGPLAQAMGQLAATALLGTMMALAQALSSVTGFLADHEAVVAAVASIYAATLVPALATAAVRLATIGWGVAASLAIQLGQALGTVAYAFTSMEHAAAMANAALAAFAPAVPFVIVAAGVYSIANAFKDAKKEVDALSKGLDLKSMGGLETLLGRLTEQKKKLSGTPPIDFFGTGLIKQAEEGKRIESQIIATNKAMVSFNENVDTVANATGTSGDAVKALADKLGIDLTQGFEKSKEARQKLIDNIKQTQQSLDKAKVAAYGAGIGMSDAFGKGAEDILAAAEAADKFADSVSKAFSDGFDVLSNFSSATKQHAQALEAQASAADKVASSQERVSDASAKEVDAYEKIGTAREKAAEAQDKVIEANDKVVESEQNLADMRVELADREAEAQEKYAQRVADSQEAIVKADERVLEARQKVVDAEEKVAEMRQNFAERAAEAQEAYARKVEDSDKNILQAEEDLAQKRIDLAQNVADAERRLEEDRLQGQERIEAAERRIVEVQQRAAADARDRQQREIDRRRLDAAASPEERRRIQSEIDARKAREDEAQARAQAAKDLKEAQDALAKAREDAAKTEAKNQEALAKAQENQSKGIQEAEDKVAEARARGLEIQKEASKLAKQQAEDEKQIAEAVKGVEDARKGVTEAEKGAADARKEALAVQKEGARLAKQQVEDERQIAEAVKRVEDARKGVLDAQKNAADATAAISDAERDAARASAEVGRARADQAKATAELADAQKKVADTSLEGFFAKQIADAKRFAEGIREAARLGLNPDYIAQLMQEGPEKAAPILDTIMSDQGKFFVDQANMLKTDLSKVQDSVIEAARVTQRAITTTNQDLAAEYGDAMKILQAKAELGGAATADALAEKLGMGVDRVRKIAQDYTIVLADGINPLLKAIGAGEITSVGRGAGGGVPAGVYVGNMAMGGTVPGQGDQDTVPAMLTPGEYVISKPAVQRIGVENLEAMHKTARRGYAQGGFVYPDDVPVPPGEMDNYGTMLGYSGAMADQKMYYAVRDFLAKHPPTKKGGGSGGSGSNYGFQSLIDYLTNRGVDFEVTSTTGGTHAANSRHGMGLAADFWSANMSAIGDAFMDVRQSMYELIHNPGYSVKGGENVDPSFWGDSTWAGHADHVHAATFKDASEGPGLPSGKSGSSDSSGTVSGGLYDWIDEAMRLTGVDGSWRDPLYRRAMYESSGDPKAINDYDSNAQAGTPSKGLMQCVPLDSEILTRDGWKRHDQVQVGEETLGFNPETQRNEWTKVTKIVHYEDAPVVRIGTRYWNARVTPNHRWWSEPVRSEIGDVGTTCPECGSEWKTVRGMTTHLGKKHHKEMPARRFLGGRFVRTNEFKDTDRLRLAAPAITDGIPCLSLDEVRIIAWLQGDGHVRPTGSGTYQATIYQSKPQMVVKLRELLATIPHGEHVRQRKPHHYPAHQFTLTRAYATELIKRSGVMEVEPEAFVLALSPEQRSAWLSAMIDAEGHRQPGKKANWNKFVRIAQKDGPLQDAIALAVYLEGYRPSYSRLRNDETNDKWSAAGHVGMCNPYVCPSMFNEPQELGPETVWCVKTDLETWTMRQGGRIMLTGNTIDSTFDAYKVPGHDDIWNPVDNMAAAIRYIEARYGSIHEIDPPTSGYGKGGLVDVLKNLPTFHAGGMVPGDQEVLARLEGGEGILSRQTMALGAPLAQQINTAVSTALGRYGASGGAVAAPPIDIEGLATRIGEQVASAIAQAGLKLEAEGRQIGVLVAEEFRKMGK